MVTLVDSGCDIEKVETMNTKKGIVIKLEADSNQEPKLKLDKKNYRNVLASSLSLLFVSTKSSLITPAAAITHFCISNIMLSQQQQQGSSTTTTVNIKAKYKDSIRRLPIHSSLTLDQLLQVLSTSFHATITRENSVIKYKDDECDLITTTNEEEWKEAVRNFSSPVLYLEIVEKKVVTKASSTPPVATTTQQPSKPSSVQPQQTPQFSMNLPNQSGGSNIALMQQKQQPQQPVVTTGSSSPPPQQQQEQKPQTPTQQQQQKPETNVPPQQVIQVQPQQQPSTIIPPQQQPSQQVPPPQPQQPSQNVEHSWSFAAVNTSVDATNWSSKFVRDVNLTDGSSVIVNQPVTKAWALKNTGTTQWPDNICLFCKDENPTYEILGSQVPRALPGQGMFNIVTNLFC